MKLNQLIKRAGIAALLTLSSGPVMAHKYWTDCNNNTPRKWPGSGFTFNANPTGFDGQYAFWRTSFATALSRFNATPVNFNVSVRLDNDTSVGVGNGESEIWWDDTGNSATGYNITNPCGVTVEGDIVFHNTVSYDDSMDQKTNFWNYGGNGRTFETTALHEVGHTVGLAHENRYYNIMGTDYTHVHTTGENALRSYLGEDTVNGLIALYGGSNKEDLSVAAWRFIGASGAYSSHGRTRLFNSSGSVLTSNKAVSSCNNTQCEMRYDVGLGQQIQYEMTLENNGRNSQTVTLGYYISTNASITNTDTLIGTDTVTVTRNTPDTVKKNVTIPSNLNPNTNYYLGVIIDNNDSVSEWTEENNTSYIHIRTGAGSQNQSPTAEANGPYNGSVNSALSFSSAGSNDPDGSISTYSWNFGDGNTSSAANPNHTYTSAGTYNVTLTVTDNGGLSDSDTATATITTDPGTTYCEATGGGNYEWIAGVSVGGLNNTSGQAAYTDFTSQTANLNTGNNSATFTPGFTNSAYTEYWSVWIDFNKDGDFTDTGEQVLNGQSGNAAVNATLNIPTSAAGVNGTRMRVAMKYNAAASSSCGDIGDGEVEDYSVNIAGGGGNQAPTANANGPYSGSVNANINFNSNGSSDPDGSIASYSWSFGDGNSSTSANPTHSYSAEGSYTATLTVTDNEGATDSDSATVTVGGTGTIEDACATEAPTTSQALTSGDAVCVPDGSNSNSIQYYYIYVPSGTNSILIRSDHGNDNGDVYYKSSSWATATSYDQRSTNSGNTESITVNNPATGYRYISVIGVRSGMTLKVELQ
ncbi:PKD domain-containing protein [Aliikangiella coralliicola]|uniref:PKD domain-containing protein n=1 Tax=Aliikangiella coralliicola TaxID=2592383 RepID=A0A545UJ03_9GAMM|nr:PKD domain-containing protein [Aliikangiella coralliicola]TQV89435.1 PKD domain-containing protein [Aliikangiella coralliicola]